MLELVEGALVGPEGCGILLENAQRGVPRHHASLLAGNEHISKLILTRLGLLLEPLAFDGVEISAVGASEVGHDRDGGRSLTEGGCWGGECVHPIGLTRIEVGVGNKGES